MIPQFDCIVGSPPYAESDQNYESGWKRVDVSKYAANRQGKQTQASYGHEPGQVGSMKPGNAPGGDMTATVEVLDWHQMYSQPWGEDIVPEAYSHPAKAAKALLRRIFTHLAERGYLPPKGMVVDVFGGVATTAIVGASMGYKCFGVELEKAFVDHGNSNLDLHRATWRAAGDPQPVHVQGDSRRLCEILLPGVAEVIVGSPPYAESATDGNRKNREANLTAAGIDPKAWMGERRCTQGRSDGYGHEPGQLGSMKPVRLENCRLCGKLTVDTQQPQEPITTQPKTPSNGPGDAMSPSVALGIPSFGTACAEPDPCTPVKTAEPASGPTTRMLSDALPVASNALTSSNSVRGPARQNSTPSAQPNTRSETSTGQVEALTSEDSRGQDKGALLSHETATSASIADGKNLKSEKSTSTTSRRQKTTEASGITPSKTSKRSARHATPKKPASVDGSSVRLCAECAARVSSQEQATLVSVPSNADAHASKRRTGHGRIDFGAMSAGTVDAVVSSPPYASSNQDYESGWKYIDKTKTKEPFRGGPSNLVASYGTTPGNLAALPPGDVAEVTVDCVVGSPPYEEQVVNKGKRNMDSIKDVPITAAQHWGRTTAEQSHYLDTYGTTPNQLGAERGDTFWAALREIVLQCRQILRVGGALAWICKDFVRKKARVPFTDDVCRLLESCGFRVVTRARCWLVKETARFVDLNGEEVVEKTERKSFFRRLAEKKGSPRIDYEEVVFAVKVDGGGGMVDACVSSPPYADQGIKNDANYATEKIEAAKKTGKTAKRATWGNNAGSAGQDGYGTSAGQLGAMKPGTIDDALRDQP